MRMWFRRILLAVTAFALFAGALATSYAMAQQNGRNEAEDAPRVLLSDLSGQPARVDLSHSLGVFWIEYDAQGHPVAGNGYLDGRLASVPSGVLETARRDGEDAVTWQPGPGLRFATVARPVGDRVVVAGQSLERTELRAERDLLYTMLALLAGAGVIGVAVAIDAVVRPRAAEWSRRLRP